MKFRNGVLASVLIWSVSFCAAFAATSYGQRVFFDNSSSTKGHYYSASTVSAPSSLAVVGERLPVATEQFRSAPNSLRLDWTSARNGGGGGGGVAYWDRDRPD